MIAQDFLRSPQKIIYWVSITGFIVCDLVIFFSTIKCFYSENDDIFDFVLLALSLSQIIIFVLILIIAITCCKGLFFQKLLGSPLYRFLLFFDLFVIHAIELFFGIFFILTDIDSLEFIERKLVFIFSFLLLAFWFIFLIGLIFSFKNHSDREIIENENRIHFGIDFLRNPPKTIFSISLIGLFSCTFIVYLLSSFWLHRCNVHFSNCPDDYSMSYCKNYEEVEFDHFCWGNVSLHFVFIFGLIQLIIVISMVMAALTCWKGQFFSKLLGIPIIRYLLIAVEAILYGFAVLTELFTFSEYEPRKKDEVLRIVTLFFASMQGLFLIIFFIGMICMFVNKSDKEITQNINPILVRNDEDF